jgi:hypothetical protein
MKSALFFGIEDKEVLKAFDNLKGKTRSGREIFSKTWMTEYFNTIRDLLLGDNGYYNESSSGSASY